MAKVLDKILGFIGLENEEDAYENDQMEAEPDYSYTRGQQQAAPQMRYEEYDGGQQQQASRSSRKPANSRDSRDNKVINVYKNNGSNNLIIFRPASCEDSSHMIDSLKSNRPVIANFENIDREKAQRILDMMSGAMYAMSGSVHQVSRSIYVFAPESMDVSGEGKEAARNVANSISNLYMDFSK